MLRSEPPSELILAHPRPHRAHPGATPRFVIDELDGWDATENDLRAVRRLLPDCDLAKLLDLAFDELGARERLLAIA